LWGKGKKVVILLQKRGGINIMKAQTTEQSKGVGLP